MERIVLGIDDAAPNRRAIEWVGQRAATREIAVELVTAFDILMSDPLEVETRLRAVGDTMRLLAPQTDVRLTFVEGAITNVLRDSSRDADLLVIGSHRSRPVWSAVTGSIPTRVASRSLCPTVVVPDDAPNIGDGPVVVGLESDGSSDAALQWAAREALAGLRELHIVHVWQVPLTPYEPFDALVVPRADEIAWHRSLMEQAASDLARRYPTLVIREQLSEAFPVTILTEASDNAALLVVGTHGRGAIGSLIFGSTAAEVLRASATPLCVVPDVEQAKEHEIEGEQHVAGGTDG